MGKLNITVENTIKLMACAVNESVMPFNDAEELHSIDYNALFGFCKSQNIAGTIAVGIKRAAVHYGINVDELDGYKKFQETGLLNIYRDAQFQVEREAILKLMDDAGIWYMPLKGIILKDVYPQVGMRSMADNDIFYDSQRSAEVRSIFESRGYTVDSFGIGHHDIYIKKPMFNFEMHNIMGEDGLDCDSYNEYYRDPSRLMIKDEGNNAGYHMSDDDFYVYMIAHAFKHYNYAGTGLRIIADIFVYINRYGSRLNWSYIEGEYEKIGMVEFAKNVRSITDKLMNGVSINKLTAPEHSMLDVMVASETYGTSEMKHRINIQKAESTTGAFDGSFDLNKAPTRLGKMKYLWYRVFPKQKNLVETYPIARHKWAIPFVHIYRVTFLATRRYKRLIKEFKSIKRI